MSNTCIDFLFIEYKDRVPDAYFPTTALTPNNSLSLSQLLPSVWGGSGDNRCTTIAREADLSLGKGPREIVTRFPPQVKGDSDGFW